MTNLLNKDAYEALTPNEAVDMHNYGESMDNATIYHVEALLENDEPAPANIARWYDVFVIEDDNETYGARYSCEVFYEWGLEAQTFADTFEAAVIDAICEAVALNYTDYTDFYCAEDMLNLAAYDAAILIAGDDERDKVFDLYTEYTHEKVWKTLHGFAVKNYRWIRAIEGYELYL